MIKTWENTKYAMLRYYGNTISRYRMNESVQRRVNCTKDQIRYRVESTTPLIYFNNGIQRGFFRECRKHEEERVFVQALLEDFSQYMLTELERDIWSQQFDALLSNPNRIRSFVLMGDGTNPYSNVSIFRHTSNPTIIGFNPLNKEQDFDILFRLVQFVWKPLSEYRYCNHLHNGEYNCYNSSRSIVTFKVACMLGLDYLIPNSYYGHLMVDSKDHFGVFVDYVDGFKPKKGNNYPIHPLFQRDTIALNVLDTICNERDHNPGNYFVKLNERGEVYSLSAFDNDAPTTLLPSFADVKSYLGSSPLIVSNIFNRPFISARLYKVIDSTLLSDFDSLLGSCSKIEISFVKYRFWRLKEAIRKSVIAGNTAILEDEKWSLLTISQEMDGSYGNTYMKIFVEHYN